MPKVKQIIFDLEFQLGDNQARLNALAKKLESVKQRTAEAKRGSVEWIQAQRELAQINRELTGSIDKSTKATTSWSTSMKKAGSALGSLFAIGSITLLARDAVGTLRDFEQGLADLSAITGATGGDLEFYSEQARNVGRTSTISAQETLEAFKLIGSAKPELLAMREELVAVTKDAVILAEASGQDLPTAAANLAGALNAMHLPASASAMVIDVLANAAQKGSKEIPFVNQALEKFGGTATLAGDKIETSVAAIEILGVTMEDASGVGTNLRNIITILRIEAQKSGRQYQGLAQELGNYAGKLDDVQGLTKIFGRENLEAFQNLVVGRDELVALSEQLGESGTAMEQAEVRTATLAGEIERLGNTWGDIVLGFQAGGGILTRAIKFVRENIKTILKVILSVAAGFVSYKVAVLASTIATNVYRVATLAMAAAKALLSGNLKRATAAQRAMNVAQKASPWGLLIGLIATAVSLLWDYGDAADSATDAQSKLNQQLEEAANITSRTQTLVQQVSIVGELDPKQLESLQGQIQAQIGQLSDIEIEATAVVSASEERIQRTTENIRRAMEEVSAKIVAEEEKIFAEFGKELPLAEEGIRRTFPALRALDKELEDIATRGERLGLGDLTKDIDSVRATGFKLPEVTNQLAVLQAALIKVEEAIKTSQAAAGKGVGTDLVRPGTIKALQDRVKELRKALVEDIQIDSPNFQPTIDKYKEALAALKVEQDKLKADQPEAVVEGSLAALQKRVKDIREQVNKANTSSAEFLKLVGMLQAAQVELNAARELLKPVDEAALQAKDLQEFERHQVALLQIEKAGEVKLLQTRIAFANARLGVLVDNGKEETAEYQKVVNQKIELEAQLAKAQTEADTAGGDKENEKKQAILAGIEEVLQASFAALNTLIDIKTREVEALIGLQQRRVDEAREIATEGNAEVLQAEEERLDKLNQKREDFVRKQQALAAAQMVAEAALAIAKAAAQGGAAAPFTIAATIIALAAGLAQARAIASQAAFFEGGYTGDMGTRQVAGQVHGQEFVIDATTTQAMGLRGMNMHQFRDLMVTRGDLSHAFSGRGVAVAPHNDELLRDIKQAIEAKAVPTWSMNKKGIVSIVETSRKKVARNERRAR